MAIQTHKNDGSNIDPNAGAVKTPPPDKDHSYGRTSYGSNAFGGPSSVTPGGSVTSPLADDLRRKSDPDGALAAVCRNGVGNVAKPAAAPQIEDWQTREVPANSIQASHGMRSRTAAQEGGKIPGSVSPNEAAPVRTPK